MKRALSILMSALLLLPFAACGGNEEGGGSLEQTDMQTGFLRTAGADDYGRSFTETEGFNGNYVGIFYFLWLSEAAGSTATVEKWNAAGKAEYTLSGAIDPETGDSVTSAPNFTWWGEPMYGYYRVEDEWVVRKHVELFINAGLDFLCFDTTNNDYYSTAARTVLDVLLEYHELGYNVPKAMFMTNSGSPRMIESIYNAFYDDDTYDAIWFTGGGEKPWILGSAQSDDEEIMDRFYFKRSQWPNAVRLEEGFPWMDWNYPQLRYTDEAHGMDIVNVSVSQHCGIGGGANFSLSGLCSPSVYSTLSPEMKAKIGGDARAETYYNRNWGRGFSHETGKNSETDALKNVNFEEQWKLPLSEKDGGINLVFVTGWNEWVAQRQPKDPVLGDDYGFYVDTYNMEFSRDLEMMAGGYLDNAYLALVRNVRAYKGAGSQQVETAATSLDLNKLGNWQNMPAYADFVKETEPRNSAGAGVGNIYTNDTGRNDIREIRVATTADSVYFLVSAVENITPRPEGDTRWMNLWIGVGGQEGGWNGLQYVVNRTSSGGKASVEKIAGGSFEPAGECDVTVSGRFMTVRISKALLGIPEGKFSLQFKATDNLQKDFDITDLYTNGDCAPIGRINYSYYAK